MEKGEVREARFQFLRGFYGGPVSVWSVAKDIFQFLRGFYPASLAQVLGDIPAFNSFGDSTIMLPNNRLEAIKFFQFLRGFYGVVPLHVWYNLDGLSIPAGILHMRQ